MNKTLYFTLGTFNVPTANHKALVDFLVESSEKDNADAVVYLYNSTSSMKKLGRMFPNVKFESFGNITTKNIVETITKTLKDLDKSYDNIVLAIDESNIGNFSKFLTEKNGKDFKFDSVKTIPTGIVDPDSSSRKELPSLVNSNIREQYFKGKIFNIGDSVYSEGKKYEVVKRCANHLVLVEDGGKGLVSKFLHEVSQTMEGSVNSDKWITAATRLLERMESTGVRNSTRAKTKIGGSMWRHDKDYVRKMKARKTIGESDNEMFVTNPAIVTKTGDDTEDIRDFNIHNYGTTGASPNHWFHQDIEKSVKVTDHTDKKLDKFVSALSPSDYWDEYSNDDMVALDAQTGKRVDPNSVDIDFELKTGGDIQHLSPEDRARRGFGKSPNYLFPRERLEESRILLEKLTRVGRIKKKLALRKTKAKRKRALLIALKRHSSQAVLRRRAIRLAIKAVKNRFLHGRNLTTLSVTEKERLEDIINKKKALVKRIAVKLIPVVKQFERTRLANRAR